MLSSRAVARLIALSTEERRIVLAAVAALPIAWCAVRLLPLSRLRIPTGPAMRPVGEISAARVAGLVDATAGRLCCGACLEISLVTAWLLRCRQMQADVVIGGLKEHATFDAHAWVESSGQIVTGAPVAARYTPLLRLS